jgi:hypothetical protein
MVDEALSPEGRFAIQWRVAVESLRPTMQQVVEEYAAQVELNSRSRIDRMSQAAASQMVQEIRSRMGSVFDEMETVNARLLWQGEVELRDIFHEILLEQLSDLQTEHEIASQKLNDPAAAMFMYLLYKNSERFKRLCESLATVAFPYQVLVYENYDTLQHARDMDDKIKKFDVFNLMVTDVLRCTTRGYPWLFIGDEMKHFQGVLDRATPAKVREWEQQIADMVRDVRQSASSNPRWHLLGLK